MKKALSVLLALSLLLTSLAACGSPSGNNSTPPADNSTPRPERQQ